MSEQYSRFTGRPLAAPEALEAERFSAEDGSQRLLAAILRYVERHQPGVRIVIERPMR